MGTTIGSIYGSMDDPLAQRSGVDYRALGEKAAQLCEGKLEPQQMAQLPWSDSRFCCFVQRIMADRYERLERHEVRFRSLREVFGPDR